MKQECKEITGARHQADPSVSGGYLGLTNACARAPVDVRMHW